MQTFLPSPNFKYSASVLDTKRLGKQRVECLQISNALFGFSRGWANHPAVRMWRCYHHALLDYWQSVIDEWVKRLHEDNTQDELDVARSIIDEDNFGLPLWMGNPDFHISHQSNLVRKDPDHYRRYFPDVPDNLPYVWPV